MPFKLLMCANKSCQVEPVETGVNRKDFALFINLPSFVISIREKPIVYKSLKV